MPKTIISLTTIPPRMQQINSTLCSLLNQRAKIDAIILWIPERYRRSEFNAFELPDVPKGVEIRRCATDYGPATKVLPTVRLFEGQDVRIIYCDDDRLYHPDWAENLLHHSDMHPGSCIAEAGEVVELTFRKAFKDSKTYSALRWPTAGIYGYVFRRKNRSLDPGIGMIDICKGYGGVLVRPEFFQAAAFEIPDILWTVDDVWLSGQLALNKIPIQKAATRENSTKTSVADMNALVDHIEEKHGRHEANMACIRYFQERHHIWLEEAAPHRVE